MQQEYDHHALYSLNDIKHTNNEQTNKIKHDNSNLTNQYLSFGASKEEALDFYIQAFEYIIRRIKRAEESLAKSISGVVSGLEQTIEFTTHLTELNKVLNLLILELEKIESDKSRVALQQFYRWFWAIRHLSSVFLIDKDIKCKEKIESIAKAALLTLTQYKSANLPKIKEQILSFDNITA